MVPWGEISLASLPAPRVLWCGRYRHLPLVYGGTLLLSNDRPVTASLLTFRIQAVFFHFSQCREPDFREALPFLCYRHSAPGVRMLPDGASQSCGMRSRRPWLWKVESSFWNPPLQLWVYKAACLSSLKPGLFAKQRQHYHISLTLPANLSSKRSP